MMTGPHSRDRLLRDLRSLGVEPGDLLFVHSSFKSLGPVEGGAGGVVAALEDAVGPEGLLMMPSFNLVEWERRAEVWDVGATPSTVGWLTEYFRLMSGTYRSDHYSHSVVARGKGARELVAGHRSQEGVPFSVGPDALGQDLRNALPHEQGLPSQWQAPHAGGGLPIVDVCPLRRDTALERAARPRLGRRIRVPAPSGGRGVLGPRGESVPGTRRQRRLQAFSDSRLCRYTSERGRAQPGTLLEARTAPTPQTHRRIARHTVVGNTNSHLRL